MGKRLGEILVAQGVLRQPQVTYGLLRQSRCPDRRIGELLQVLGFVSLSQVENALAEQQLLRESAAMQPLD